MEKLVTCFGFPEFQLQASLTSGLVSVHELYRQRPAI